MVIRPYGYALWENIQKFMDVLIKKHNVDNAYFPLFIPMSFFEKEKEHIEGFAPELAIVTVGGGKELAEKLAVRPTSETIMYHMYQKWFGSLRDLPVRINQWCNMVRWEKRTYLFLRTSEFLWQEGHCAHLTHKESMEEVMWAIKMYAQTYQELFGMYGIIGAKSESEKFAGGAKSYTFEALMPNGKALQAGTSHDLGQNFSKSIDWTVQDQKGEKAYPYGSR
jgi:prolyl-tRNA synthetase